MRPRMKAKAILLALGALLLLVSVVGAQAGAGPGYDLSWWTVDGGGATLSANSGYSLGGTAGQADAGALVGGDYTLVGGFWGGAVTRYDIFLPLVLRNF
jgi:hypothetical protein